MSKPADVLFKVCKDCKRELPSDEFYENSNGSGNRQAYCKSCHHKRSNQWRDTNVDRSRVINRNAHIRSLYGIEPEEYFALLESQGGVCAICKLPPKGTHSRNKYLHVDHNPKTGLVRGLLCDSCNNGLGRFEDDPERLRRAADYLAKQPQ
jgi:hypothetical protein